jgi:hypothetical protein
VKVSLVSGRRLRECRIDRFPYAGRIPHWAVSEREQCRHTDGIIGFAGSGGEAMYGGLASGGGGIADWRSSLSVLAANRTPGDEVAFIRLGDRLWYEQGQVSPSEESTP